MRYVIVDPDGVAHHAILASHKKHYLALCFIYQAIPQRKAWELGDQHPGVTTCICCLFRAAYLDAFPRGTLP